MSASPDREVETLQTEIDQTRAALAETVQELAARVDVPARARAAWTQRTQQVRRVGSRPAVWLVVAGAAGTAAVAVLLLARGRCR